MTDVTFYLFPDQSMTEPGLPTQDGAATQAPGSGLELALYILEQRGVSGS